MVHSTTGGIVAYYTLLIYILASLLSGVFAFTDWVDNSLVNRPGRIYRVKSHDQVETRKIVEVPYHKIKFEGNSNPIWVQGITWLISIVSGVLVFLVADDVLNIWFEVISNVISGTAASK